jgi:DNA-binding SARP family transcriptional activator
MQPSGNLAESDARVADVEALADPANPGDQLRLAFLQCRLARARGDGERALFHAIRATQYARELELPPPMLAVYLVNDAQARLAGDNVAAALAGLREASALAPGAYADEVRDMIGLVEAYDDLRSRNPRGRERMAAAWAAMRERQFYDTFDGYPEFGARMCVLALEEGIESEFVATLIRLRGIAPPPDAPENWPWPLKIYTLGGFRVERDGQPLAIEGKAQKKPLELLKVLVALGGQGVPKARLQDLLWPDGEPAAGAAALDMAISRLRKLLDVADLVRVEDGKATLDPRKVWVDAVVFDREVDAAQASLKSGDAQAVGKAGERLLARYRGPFLGAEEPQRWSLATRDRLHHRFLRSLAGIAQCHARAGALTEAIACYERAIDEDSLAEELYRDLIRCHLARGEPADAARVYRRCRDMLSIQLGIPPSPETEALFRSIYER